MKQYLIDQRALIKEINHWKLWDDKRLLKRFIKKFPPTEIRDYKERKVENK